MLYFEDMDVECVLRSVEGYIENEKVPEAIVLLSAIVEEHSIEDVLCDIVSTDMIDDLIADKLEEGGWTDIYDFLKSIEREEEEFYKINAEGVLGNVEIDDIEQILNEIKRELGY